MVVVVPNWKMFPLTNGLHVVACAFRCSCCRKFVVVVQNMRVCRQFDKFVFCMWAPSTCTHLLSVARVFVSRCVSIKQNKCAKIEKERIHEEDLIHKTNAYTICSHLRTNVTENISIFSVMRMCMYKRVYLYIILNEYFLLYNAFLRLWVCWRYIFGKMRNMSFFLWIWTLWLHSSMLII